MCYNNIYNMYYPYFIRMSLITTLSIKEEYKQDYYSLRNKLNMNNLSIGDYLITEYRKNKNTLAKK